MDDGELPVLPAPTTPAQTLSEFDKVLNDLNERFQCRGRPIRQLVNLLWPSLPNPSTIVCHGLAATGKSAIVNNLLVALENLKPQDDRKRVYYTVIKSAECITVRHLLERAVSGYEAAFTGEEVAKNRCESINALAIHLQRLAEHATRSKPLFHFLMVFDGVDRQRESPPNLLPALSRLGDMVPHLTVLLIMTAPRSRAFHETGVPHVYFPPYSREEVISVVSRFPRRIDENEIQTSVDADEESSWIWTRYCAVVWDSLAKGAARDLVQYRAVCDQLWRRFVGPIVDGTYGTRDFSKLVVSRRALFQNEEPLVERVIPKERESGSEQVTHELPFFSKYLLCAAYLASYNPARQDQTFFMKASLGAKGRRKRAPASTVNGVNKSRKITRRLLGPQPFVLERLSAIFHSIVPPSSLPSVASIDIQTQISTLSSLRLISPTSASGAPGSITATSKGARGSGDVLEPTTKYRAHISWDYTRRIARSVGLDIEDYMAE